MADNIVNLNKARKDRDKAQRSAKAAENRVLFGQTKGQKAKTMTLAQKVKQALDAHKRDRKD
jgi:adenylosuccinate lyase